MKHYKNDPRLIETRFHSKCATCGKSLTKGTSTYYWPSSRKAFCLACGEQDYSDFLAAAFDEDMSNQLYR